MKTASEWIDDKVEHVQTIQDYYAWILRIQLDALREAAKAVCDFCSAEHWPWRSDKCKLWHHATDDYIALWQHATDDYIAVNGEPLVCPADEIHDLIAELENNNGMQTTV